MRALAAASLAVTSLAALAVLATAALARADEPIRIELEVGERSGSLGIMPICDDLSIVSADATGVKALKVGQTLCSYDRSGGAGRRQVYRIVVVPPRKQPAPASGAPERGADGSAREASPPRGR